MSISPAGLDEATFKDTMARIDRQQAETRKVAAEQARLAAGLTNLRSSGLVGPVVVVSSIIGACANGVAAFAAWFG